MRVFSDLSAIFLTFLTLQNGRRLQSFRMFTGLLRIVFLRSFAGLSFVFLHVFQAYFDRLSSIFRRIFVNKYPEI